MENLIIQLKMKIMFILDCNSYSDEEKINMIQRIYQNIKKLEKFSGKVVPSISIPELNIKLKNCFINYTLPNLNISDLDIVSETSRKLEQNIPPTLEETTMFLDYFCVLTRFNLFNYDYNNIFLRLVLPDIDHYNYEWRCGYSSQLLLANLLRYNLKAIEFDLMDIIPSASHEVVVVDVPIIENDKVSTKRFLIDCTYRQFFMMLDCNKCANHPNVGYYMSLNEEKQEFATKLLKNGYFELTEENIKLYLDGFYLESQGEFCFDYQAEKIEKPIVYSGGDYLELIAKNRILTKLNIEKLEQDFITDYSNEELVMEMINKRKYKQKRKVK